MTCLYGVLDPDDRPLRLRERGPQPALRPDGRRRRRAARHAACRSASCRGWRYEEKEATLAPGESVLLYSDGVIEAHDPEREMFGFPRLRELMAARPRRQRADRRTCSTSCTPSPAPTGSRRTTSRWSRSGATAAGGASPLERRGADPDRDRRAGSLHFELPSEPGNEREAMDRVAERRRAGWACPRPALERLKTAVSRGDDERDRARQPRTTPPIPVEIDVTVVAGRPESCASPTGAERPSSRSPRSRTSRRSSPASRSRAAGACFLIKHMVDAMEVVTDGNGRRP